MKPRQNPAADDQGHLFRIELADLVDPAHPLVKLAGEVNWAQLDETFGVNYSDQGRPGIPTMLMVALHYLKYTFDLSDEAVVQSWVENPYWQYFSGRKFFEHNLPIVSSSMTRWRARVGDAGAEELLKETIAAGLRMKLIKPTQLARVNVDTTVQEKNIRYPTDARSLSRARERLVDLAKAEGIELRQSYVRVGKQVLHQQSRYAHARQFKRARKAVKKLRTYLGRVIRDIERKTEGQAVSEDLQELLVTGRKLLLQERNSKNKVYSVHAPEVECISKGKAHKRYEFGCKVSVAATSKVGWVVAAQAQHGNPYDGHTLASTIEQFERLTNTTPNEMFVDMGYRKHDYTGTSLIHVDRRRRGNIPPEHLAADEAPRCNRTNPGSLERQQEARPEQAQRRTRGQDQRHPQRCWHELPQNHEGLGTRQRLSAQNSRLAPGNPNQQASRHAVSARLKTGSSASTN